MPRLQQRSLLLLAGLVLLFGSGARSRDPACREVVRPLLKAKTRND
jgi:hypothetical protein